LLRLPFRSASLCASSPALFTVQPTRSTAARGPVNSLAVRPVSRNEAVAVRLSHVPVTDFAPPRRQGHVHLGGPQPRLPPLVDQGAIVGAGHDCHSSLLARLVRRPFRLFCLLPSQFPPTSKYHAGEVHSRESNAVLSNSCPVSGWAYRLGKG